MQRGGGFARLGSSIRTDREQPRAVQLFRPVAWRLTACGDTLLAAVTGKVDQRCKARDLGAAPRGACCGSSSAASWQRAGSSSRGGRSSYRWSWCPCLSSPSFSPSARGHGGSTSRDRQAASRPRQAGTRCRPESGSGGTATSGLRTVRQVLAIHPTIHRGHHHRFQGRPSEDPCWFSEAHSLSTRVSP